MINIKTYFVIASLAIGVHATAPAAVEVAGSLVTAAAPAATAAGSQVASPAAKTPAKPAEQALTVPSDWSMLLVGAGVLLLPRKRRVDNLVR